MSIKIAMTLLSICCVLLSIVTIRHTTAIWNIQKQLWTEKGANEWTKK